ncbi:MAG: FAD-dependent oxidoreductase [Hydrogenophaga sp.]
MTYELRHALVIGAGLAGAAACVALVRKGWRVTLIDGANGPAQAASGLPVGMLSPHVTRSPTPLSRLCELGVEMTRAELQRSVPQGAGWQACEVDNLLHDTGRWPAALVRPGALVQAWLEEAMRHNALTTLWGAQVQALRQAGMADGSVRWNAVNSDGQTLAQAPCAVVAGALGSLALLSEADAGLSSEALPLRPVKGQMSLAAQDGAPMAERPQRQNGVFVPDYEDSGLPPNWPARIWSMGATYDRGDDTSHTTDAAHQRNAESLRAILPAAGAAMEAAISAGALLGWAQVRCASLDRLPLAGGLPNVASLHRAMDAAGSQRGRLPLEAVPRLPGLFTLSALGSRGLTLALPLGQRVADAIAGDASPLPMDLQRSVDPARFAWRLARRQPAHR